MKKRFLALLFVCLAICMSLVGCSDASDEARETGAETTQEQIAATLSLVAEGESAYIILRSSEASEKEINAALQLRQAIETQCGVKLSIMNELHADVQNAICVGSVPHDSVTALAADLGYTEYVIGVRNHNLVLCGGSEDKTAEAVECFIADYLAQPTQTLSVPADLLIEMKDPNAKKVQIGNAELQDYVIVIDSNAVTGIKNEAEALRQLCIDRFGIGVEIRTAGAKETPNEILIGNISSRTPSAALEAELAACGEDKGLVWFENGKIWLTGNHTAAVRDAVLTFTSEYLNVDRALDGVLELPTECRRMDAIGKEYTVMSFNLLCNSGDGKYDQPEARKDAVIAQIKETSPDLLGVQECTVFWYDALCGALGDAYGVVGEINNPGGQNWRNAIFYRKETFELVKNKTQWLSSMPSSMSKFDVSTQYRILTYAVLRDKETGETLTHCNTHMGFEADERPLQYNVLLKLVGKLEGPILLTGDFNVTPSNEYYKQVQAAGYISAHEMTADWDDTPTASKTMIDFCFVTPDTVNVMSHEVLEETVNGINPSDHNAVEVHFRLR